MAQQHPPDPGPDPQKRANPPALENALIGLWLASYALETFNASENDPCTCPKKDGDCPACFADSLRYDAEGLSWTLNHLTADFMCRLLHVCQTLRSLHSRFMDGVDWQPEALATYLLAFTGKSQAEIEGEQAGADDDVDAEDHPQDAKPLAPHFIVTADGQVVDRLTSPPEQEVHPWTLPPSKN